MSKKNKIERAQIVAREISPSHVFYLGHAACGCFAEPRLSGDLDPPQRCAGTSSVQLHNLANYLGPALLLEALPTHSSAPLVRHSRCRSSFLWACTSRRHGICDTTHWRRHRAVGERFNGHGAQSCAFEWKRNPNSCVEILEVLFLCYKIIHYGRDEGQDGITTLNFPIELPGTFIALRLSGKGTIVACLGRKMLSVCLSAACGKIKSKALRRSSVAGRRFYANYLPRMSRHEMKALIIATLTFSSFSYEYQNHWRLPLNAVRDDVDEVFALHVLLSSLAVCSILVDDGRLPPLIRIVSDSCVAKNLSLSLLTLTKDSSNWSSRSSSWSLFIGTG